MRNKTFQIAKIIQFIIITALEVSMVFLLVTQPGLAGQILKNTSLLPVFAIIWIIMVFNLFFLFLDFLKLYFSEEEKRSLKRTAYMDVLTNFPNRQGLDAIFRTYNTPEDLANIGCLIVKIQNLDVINQTQGHLSGDRLIQNFCGIFKSIGNQYGIVGRNGSNEFISIIKQCDESRMESFIRDMTDRIEEYNLSASTSPIMIKYAYIVNAKEHKKTFKELITAVYTKIK